MVWERDRGEVGVLVATEMLDAVQVSIREALAAAPLTRSLADVAMAVLSEPTRVLGGRLTPWALMPLCCCDAVCGDWRRAIPAATASEIYITALDLLDDVEDGDACSAADQYGVAVTLNLTTALMALSHLALRPIDNQDILARHRAADALWAGLAEATGGQHVDLATAGGAPLSVEECLEIARRKGGALSEACCRAGAAYGTADQTLIDLVGQVGRSLGLAAQLDNDMHDAADGRRKSDLARRTQTVPLAVARSGVGTGLLEETVWTGGIQLTYALKHAERARAEEAVDAIAARCPDPARARAALQRLVSPGAPDIGSDP